MLTFPKQVEAILKDGHEIAAHGVYHEKILTLTPERERELMTFQVDQHQRVLGRRPRGYRSPSWDFSKITLSLLEEYGFEWDYENGNKFGPPSRILEIPVSWYLDDFPFVEFYPSVGLPGATSAQMLFERWKDTFDYGFSNVPNGVFTLTVHPQTIGRAQHIMMFERLIKHMREYSEVWFASLSEIYDCWQEA
jgi:peptidoglycan/xylan/chitin deacetylase (PgdA/CDA1 family)